jgi:hypothetical protein
MSVAASDFETIGMDVLRNLVPSLNGSGVDVAQPEAGAPFWQVNPAAVGQPESLFTWWSSAGSSSSFPNALGSESGHANEVGWRFFGLTNGIAPGVAHVDSYDANYFFNSLIARGSNIQARVVNQSFIFGSEAPDVDLDYDNYVDEHGTLIFNGVGNTGPVSSPATAYNVVGVAAYGGSSSIGPTLDGRCKPDLTAPASVTSYSTPLAAGAAALLVQAGLRGDGGGGTATAAADARTIKALLLNGATKPPDWTNGLPQVPLDLRYGAGVVHIWNSYRQLRGGQHAPAATQTLMAGSAHPPIANTTNVPSWRGWDLKHISHPANRDVVAHYFFDVTRAGRTASATLCWNRHAGALAANNLDLFLYDASTGNLIASSESLLDNVEHLRALNLPTGRYDLQVLKRGGVQSVSNTETFALAYEFGPPAPPVLTNQVILGGQFQATVSGEPNQNYAVQFSPDLSTWTSVLTNTTSASGAFTFTQAASAARRFYRVVERP